MAHRNLEVILLAWMALALKDKAPDLELDYWVTFGNEGSYPFADFWAGFPQTGLCSAAYSTARCEWPVRQDQVNDAAEALVSALRAERVAAHSSLSP